MKNYLSEAFQELKILEEEKFDLMDSSETQEMSDFVNNDTSLDYEEIIDPLATTEEELQDSYVGKVILDCVVCQSKIYKSPEEIILDETEELANVGEECPYCQSVDGYKIIGQVAEYCKDCKDDSEDESKSDEVEIETKDEETEEVKESEDGDLDENLEEAKESDYNKIMKVLNKKEESLDSIDADADDKKEKARNKFAKAEDDADADRDYKLKKQGVKENFQKVDIETDKEKMTMTSDDNGKVTVTTEPKEIATAEEEVIAPLQPEVEAEFKTEAEIEEPTDNEYIDVDFDEFDEDKFNDLGEQYLRRVYENVASFKTTNGSIKDTQLKLEGLITFKSGKTAKTNFIFEAASADKSGKVKFTGLNEQFAKGKKTYTLVGNIQGKKLVTESLTYNYRGKDSKSGGSKRIYGHVISK